MGRERNARQLREIIDEAAARKDWPAGNPEQLLGDYYASCMDEAGVDAAGLKPLAPLLAQLEAVEDLAGVQRAIRRLHELAINAPFGETGAFDNREPTRFNLNLVAGGLGLPEPRAYLSAEPKATAAREAYFAHVARMLETGGLQGPAAREAAGKIVALERRLAEASLDPQAAQDPAKTDHPTTFAQLERLTPHFDWKAYFSEAGVPRGEVNVAEPGFFAQLDKELAGTPVATWKAYLKWQLLESAAPSLSREFVQASAAAGKPRPALCAESTEALLADALSRRYVEKHFPPAAQAKARELAQQLLKVLEEELSAVEWLSPAAKAKALEKLATTHLELGFPAQWKDTSKLRLRRDSFWANVAQARRLAVDGVRAQIGKPTDRNGWALPAFSPSAYIELQLNELVLPAGFLQPPLFDPQATDAVNYGSFGATLAHDLSHAIDATGVEFDELGRPRPWWSEADQQQYRARTQCLVDQYDADFIAPGVHHNGRQVLSEALGDRAGLHVAWLALQRSMQRKPATAASIDGFTPEQQLFISWGQVRGEAVRPEAQRQMIKDDIHAVPRARVNLTVSTLPEFRKAFACKAEAKLVREVEPRCKVW